ncbi:uncharacterized protein LOC144659187 [Oculina patagonica]
MLVIMKRQIICSTAMLFFLFILMWTGNDGALSNKVPPKVMLPATIVRALPDYVLSFSATGTPPIYTAIIRKKKRKNKILVTTTSTPNIRLTKDANYICVATNKYGIDQKKFSVILTTGCGSPCSYWYGYNSGNSLSCYGALPADIIKCASTITEILYGSSMIFTIA